MPKLREILIRIRRGQSLRGISRETGTHRKIVREMLELARLQGWLTDDIPLPSEGMLAQALDARTAGTERAHPLDRYRDEIEGWIKDKYSYMVIHRMLSSRCTCSEATVRRYAQRVFPTALSPVIPRDTVPGEVMEVDYGYLGITFDPITRRQRKTWIFSGRLRHSLEAYREIVFSQRQEVFFSCHIHAFEHFGGVPRKVVSDNLKAAVIKASLDDPLINRSYRMLAEHYGFLISPNLPYHPRHKV